MDETSIKLTIFFEEPFWVGVFEKASEGYLKVCKITFGAEPKDYEVLELILRRYYSLNFSPAVEFKIKQFSDNPKRRQREVKKQVHICGVGTKSQQALKAQHDETKNKRKKESREKRDIENERQFKLKQQKRKEKHRGH